MPFVANFAATQPVGEPSVITLTDTSTGSDGAITQRRVYLRTEDGSFLTPANNPTDYIEWAYADSTIDIDVLDVDYALQVIVEWLNVGNAVLYDKTSLELFSSYGEDFDYGTTQQLTGNPSLFNDNRFFLEKSNLRTYLDSAAQAITRASDQYGAQECLNGATKLRLGSQYFFNINA
jgi:hypothetical protein